MDALSSVRSFMKPPAESCRFTSAAALEYVPEGNFLCRNLLLEAQSSLTHQLVLPGYPVYYQQVPANDRKPVS